MRADPERNDVSIVMQLPHNHARMEQTSMEKSKTSKKESTEPHRRQGEAEKKASQKPRPRLIISKPRNWLVSGRGERRSTIRASLNNLARKEFR